MKFHIYSTIAILIFLLSGCATQNVRMDYDRSVDFSQYKSYNFYDNIEWDETNALDQVRILEAIEYELNSKGMTKSDYPDLLIDVKSDEKMVKRNTGSVGFGSGSSGRRGGFGVSLGIPISSNKLHKNYIIEMVEAKSNHLVWQGIFEKDMSPNVDNAKHIPKAMNKLLSKYPPKK